MRERLGKVIESRELAPQVTLVTVQCCDPKTVQPRAGQFVSIRVPSGGRRSYSIVSGSGERDSFEIVIKSTASDGGSAEIISEFVAGADVQFFGPMGYFLFNPSAGREIFLGATGIGISALIPMINEALATQDQTVELWWGLRQRADFLFEDRLEGLTGNPRFSYKVLYSGDGDGYITSPLATRVAAAKDPHVYLCGHGQMIADVRTHLGPAFEPERLHTEVFYPAVS